ncbi:hypothetical protein, partial [Liquorilactobacillus mali]|uniref:hypothetical protein n=1 Tax=Liquorilactobacillus mali TaxID=1618 RepID=UPI0002492EBF
MALRAQKRWKRREKLKNATLVQKIEFCLQSGSKCTNQLETVALRAQKRWKRREKLKNAILVKSWETRHT